MVTARNRNRNRTHSLTHSLTDSTLLSVVKKTKGVQPAFALFYIDIPALFEQGSFPIGFVGLSSVS